MTLADGDAILVTFTNEYTAPAPPTGSITIAKVVENGDEQDPSKEFSFTIAGPGGRSESFTLQAGGTKEYADIPIGEYVITESGAGTGWTTTVSGGTGSNPCTVTLADGDAILVTFTNYFTQGNIITAAFIMGYNNPNCAGESLKYFYGQPEPEPKPDEIEPDEPWLTITNPNLKSVHFFINITADDSPTVTYRYTTSIIKEDAGVISPIEANWRWSTLSEEGTLTGPDSNGEYVFASNCMIIPGDPSTSDYPHHFYIDIDINSVNSYRVHIW